MALPETTGIHIIRVGSMPSTPQPLTLYYDESDANTPFKIVGTNGTVYAWPSSVLATGDNPQQVSAGEITAGTETALRSYSVADLVAIVAAHGGGGGGGGATYAVKSADQGVTNSTDFVAVTDLSIPVTNGTRYHVRGLLHAIAQSTPNIRLQITVPGGTSGFALWRYGSQYDGKIRPWSPIGNAISFTIYYGGEVVEFEAIFTAGADGAIGLDMTQLVSSPNTVTIGANSALILAEA